MVSLGEQTSALRTTLSTIDFRLLSGEDAAAAAEDLATTEKACAAARARAAVRASECRAHESRGFGDASDWLARVSGSSLGGARAALDVASKATPAVFEAMTAGELSVAQAQLITRTVDDCPGSEGEMLPIAQESAMASLREESRRRRLGAADVEELHQRQWRNRELRHWRDDAGMVRLAGALPPELGVPFAKRLDHETDRIRRAARRQGSTEPRAAHAADALVVVTSGEGAPRSTSAEVVVVCDLRAFRRGRHGLEWDHVDPVANGGPTSYENLEPRCWHHHRAKTESDRAAGRLGPRASAHQSNPASGRSPP